MLLAIKLARLADPALDESVAAIETRLRATKPGAAGWTEIYRDALDLVALALRAQETVERRSHVELAEAEERKRLQAASLAVPAVLSRVASDYQGRLSVQEAELNQKTERAITKLSLESHDSAATGETTFTFSSGELSSFWEWLREGEAQWRRHNETLVADRANEAVAVHLTELTSTRFTVASPRLEPRPVGTKALKGHSSPTPGAFESFVHTWKTAASVTGSLTILSMLLSYVFVRDGSGNDQTVNLVRGVIIGGVFFVTLFVAGFVTVPKQRRQQRNRVRGKAQDAVAKELFEAAKARVRESGEAQLRSIRAHLAAEADRWKAQVSRMTTAEMRMPGMQAGLSPENRAKLEGEWPHAIEARLAELAPKAATTALIAPSATTKGKTQLMR